MQYDITKKLAEAGITAAEVNTALSTSRYDHPITESTDADYARSSRDYDRVMTYIAKVQDERAAAAAATTEAPAEEVATSKQVDFIMTMIARGAHTEGGFVRGPRTREAVATLTKSQASLYITSLKGEY